MEHTSTDLRVKRTLRSIRSAFYQLVMEKDYDDISITDLTNLAEINRKTFYLHYSSLDDLANEIKEEIVSDILEKIRKDAENLDVAGCLHRFYHYLEECDGVKQKLLCDPHYHVFYEDVTDALLKTPAFQPFFQKTRYPEVVRSYTMAITFIYRNWVNSGRTIPLDELVNYANTLILHGYDGALAQPEQQEQQKK